MFVLMSLIGAVRGSILLGDYEIMSILENLQKSGFALDTAYASFHTSSSFVVTCPKIPFETRISQFSQFLISIFLGGRGMTDYEPAYAVLKYVPNNGGTFVSHYFYYYIGIAGTILGGALVSIYINLIRKASNNHRLYTKCVIIYVVSSTFRWYLYTPLGLLRGVLLLSILYYCCYIFFKMTHARRVSTNLSNAVGST